MSKSLLYLLFTICFLLDKSRANAQCGFTATAVSTESRCKESGTITITPSSADLYTYQIMAHINLVGTTQKVCLI